MSLPGRRAESHRTTSDLNSQLENLGYAARSGQRISRITRAWDGPAGISWIAYPVDGKRVLVRATWRRRRVKLRARHVAIPNPVTTIIANHRWWVLVLARTH